MHAAAEVCPGRGLYVPPEILVAPGHCVHAAGVEPVEYDPTGHCVMQGDVAEPGAQYVPGRAVPATHAAATDEPVRGL